MAQTANDVVGVVLGEAKGGSYRDMLHVASVVANRARQLGVSLQEVVSNKREFNAYGKALPPGVSKYRDMAQKAIQEVLTKGPVTPATFYATPAAAKNLPTGLQKVTSTVGHEYYVDPQNRAINTAVGYRQPSLGMMELAPSMVQDGTVRTAMADPRMDARLGDVVPSLSRAGFGDLGVMSGYRDPAKNASVGGARKSQHIQGKAIDVRGLGLTDDKKADLLDRALMAGARGVGLYTGPNQGIHLDVRDKGAFWGANYSGLTAEQAPGWARNQIGQLLSLDDTNTYLPTRAANIPVPTPRAAMAPMAIAQAKQKTATDMAAAKAAERGVDVPSSMVASRFDKGGILGPAQVSLNPVGQAQASTTQSKPASLAPDRKMPSGPVAPARKTSTGLSYSLAAAPKDVISVDRKMSTPAAPMSVGKYSPVSKPAQATPASLASAYGQYAQSRMAAPVAAPVAAAKAPSKEMTVAGYNQYGMTRAIAPNVAVNQPAVAATGVPAVSTQRAVAPAPAPSQIAGPLNTPSIQAPRQQIATPAPAPKQNPISKAISKVATPENLAAASLSAVGGAVAGPIGGILGGLLGKQLGKNGLPSNINNQPMSINNIGRGLAAVSQAMGGQRGTQANYSHPGGGGTVTSLGNGSYRRDSVHGWSEVTDAAGNTSASGRGGGGLLSGLLGGLMGGSQTSSSGKKK